MDPVNGDDITCSEISSEAAKLSPVAEDAPSILHDRMLEIHRGEGRVTERGSDQGTSLDTQNDLQTTSQKKTARNRSSSFPLRDYQSMSLGDNDHSPARRKSVLPPLHIDSQIRPAVMRLSPTQIYDLTSAPESLPVRPVSPVPDDIQPLAEIQGNIGRSNEKDGKPRGHTGEQYHAGQGSVVADLPILRELRNTRGEHANGTRTMSSTPVDAQPKPPFRSMSIPLASKKGRSASEYSPRDVSSPSSRLSMRQKKDGSAIAKITPDFVAATDPRTIPPPSPVPSSIPLPPFSLPTYLQLELSSDRPSPLYIHRSATSDLPYESSQVKFQRLLNFLLLPPYVEQVLLFGALTCLDSWLYTFTILPLRFCKSLWMLAIWVGHNLVRELRDGVGYVCTGYCRLWRRDDTQRQAPESPAPPIGSLFDSFGKPSYSRRLTSIASRSRHSRRHQPKTSPSTLQQNHKADLLQGLLIIISCIILTRFDASRMYHNIRGQAAIKLYVIYNVLEVGDRLFSALGQDILECLFSRETLERNADGRSKIFRPFWMFLLALVYTVIHSTALFYQVITLNVAVNSYSNALLTLLMSNQFVEIKGTVFKKFEKENLFQLTCADIVERFQLWLMLLIIALRNIVEVGGLSINTGSFLFSGPSSSSSSSSSSGSTAYTAPKPNTTTPISSTFSILPNAFTLLPALIPFQVLSPFLLVLGSEMLVDWLKHAYITKFNATSPRIYTRFLDILTKDYYSHAFVDQNLTRRLGLPVIPLACLFIRAALQTYHMFLATNIAAPVLSTATSLAVDATPELPTSSPLLAQLDMIFRRALGHSSFGGGSSSSSPSSTPSWSGSWSWTLDDAIALATMLLFFLALYLVLLALKLALGMVLLRFARGRYKDMKAREAGKASKESEASREIEKGNERVSERVSEPGTMRLGGWGVTEVGEERRRVIYDEAPAELGRLREREAKARAREKERVGMARLEDVERYEMVAKRIW